MVMVFDGSWVGFRDGHALAFLVKKPVQKFDVLSWAHSAISGLFSNITVYVGGTTFCTPTY